MPELSFEPIKHGYLSPKQMEEMAGDKAYLVKQMADPNIEDKGDVARLLRRLEKQVNDQTPPHLAGEALDQAMSQRRELEAYIPVGMPTHSEMRKSPDGAVGQHMRWDAAKKAAVLMWKDLMRVTEWGDTDPDLCNVERLRPNGAQRGLHSAKIPGKDYHFAPASDDYREKWDAIFGDKSPEEIATESMAMKDRLAAMEARLDQLSGDKPEPSQTDAEEAPARLG